jgi:uncharacterized protein YegP (UPF0339 family)
MTTGRDTGGTLSTWYRNRIAEPTTDDEARGYWLFALGVVLGLIGILLFLTSVPAGGVRMISIVLASAGLTLVFAGPIIRLPLRRAATWLVYLGVILCALAIVWFITAFPAQWSPTSGQPTIIGLYAIGLLVMALGGVFIPVLSAGPERDDEMDTLRSERDEAREAVTDSEADEADLAAQLRALRRSQARFELYQSRDDQWRWRLRHRNGNVIADSGESYTRRHNAQNGIESVRRNALGASLFVIESEAELPAAEETFEPVAEATSRATYELYEDQGGEWRWRLVHDNGNILADGSEGYGSRRGVEEAVDNVKGYIGPADYLRPDPTAFEVYRDRAGEYRWRLVHENGRILADGGEGYTRRNDANRAVTRIKDRAGELEAEVYEDRRGEHRWRLRGANNQIVADSGEGYDSADGAEEGLQRVREYAPDADVLDIGRAAFEVYDDEGGEVRWRLRARNGNVLADSGEGYDDRSGVWEAIGSVKRNGPNAESTDVE